MRIEDKLIQEGAERVINKFFYELGNVCANKYRLLSYPGFGKANLDTFDEYIKDVENRIVEVKEHIRIARRYYGKEKDACKEGDLPEFHIVFSDNDSFTWKAVISKEHKKIGYILITKEIMRKFSGW
jgi:hypothetical protein